ncbi:MAG: OadG family protein [Lachnospiraceae bacterium]|nr:OadG family protein [Lachnospiraceae bacterium]
MGASDEQITQIVDIYNDYKDYEKAKEEYGDFKKITDTSYSLASTSASVGITIQTEKGKKVVFTMNYDKNGEMTDHKYEEFQSVSQIMGRAALNTIMSMAIVFAVLIFIALIISCFKFIGAAQKKPAVETKTEAPAPVVETVEEEDLTDDLELVAVIAAAIAAAEEMESTDGLVIRSIIRR